MSGSLEPDLREGLESDLYNGCKCRPDFVVEIRHVWAIEAGCLKRAKTVTLQEKHHQQPQADHQQTDHKADDGGGTIAKGEGFCGFPGFVFVLF
jgi:hypothetical protein